MQHIILLNGVNIVFFRILIRPGIVFIAQNVVNGVVKRRYVEPCGYRIAVIESHPCRYPRRRVLNLQKRDNIERFSGISPRGARRKSFRPCLYRKDTDNTEPEALFRKYKIKSGCRTSPDRYYFAFAAMQCCCTADLPSQGTHLARFLGFSVYYKDFPQ